MKKRTGFVSNSSSSSFIVGYGAILKNKKSDVEKFFKKHGICNGDYEIRSVEEIYMTEGTKYAIGFIDYEIPLDKFDSKDLLLLVAIANNEGDSDGVFYREEDDYDSGWWRAENPDFYPENQQTVIAMLESGKFFDKNKPYAHSIGAARNGQENGIHF